MNPNELQEAEATSGSPPDQESPMEDSTESGSMSEICVPIDSLSMPDDQEQLSAPAVGDKGNAQIDWTVTRIEGNNAYITVDAINGQDTGGDGKPVDEMSNLEDMANNMPQS